MHERQDDQGPRSSMKGEKCNGRGQGLCATLATALAVSANLETDFLRSFAGRRVAPTSRAKSILVPRSCTPEKTSLSDRHLTDIHLVCVARQHLETLLFITKLDVDECEIVD